MSDEPAVICQVCNDAEVDDPWVDYCHLCGKKICDDCIASTNEEHGLRFCQECDDAGLVDYQCPACEGEGDDDDRKPCRACNGTGIAPKEDR